MNDQILQQNAQESALATNKVLTNTYFLLGLTLVWSAIVAGTAMALQLPRVNFIITLVGFYGLLFMIEKNKESSLGLLFTFLLTGFMGYTLGPILNMYIGAGLEGAILTALAGTALTFLSCSAYALTTKRDLSFLGGMLTAGFFAIIAMMIANIFLQSAACSYCFQRQLFCIPRKALSVVAKLTTYLQPLLYTYRSITCS
jgi:modulator of FtsH protease